MRRWVLLPQVVVCSFAICLFVLGGAMLQGERQVFRHPARPTDRGQVRAAYQPVDCSKAPCMALTFDDGPDPVYTPRILEILRRHKVRATFFVLGAHVPGNEELLRRIYSEGHEIGNHTWGHPDLTTLNPEQVEDQVAHTQFIIAAAGVPAPKMFRPPYGAVNDMVKAHVPLSIVRWNIDPEDWKAKEPAELAMQVFIHARPGGIVILHDTEARSADALETILQGLEGQYHLVTASDLLNIHAAQPGVFFGR